MVKRPTDRANPDATRLTERPAELNATTASLSENTVLNVEPVLFIFELDPFLTFVSVQQERGFNSGLRSARHTQKSVL